MRIHIHRWAFAALLAASLGFGAARAVAAPAAPAGASRCDPVACTESCRRAGGIGTCVGRLCACAVP